ncbi:MAG TPA: DUF2934 domain-containing protein [Candidatus Acidoferrum sp.]|jgi:hypothetical protein|nr:DUF2934 domain-containing protein [Candidatus Acidoferrum sp.]
MPKTRETASLKVRNSPTAKKHPTREEIALRAYHIYLERGGASGNALEDWTRAERELLGEKTKPRRKVRPISIAA